MKIVSVFLVLGLSWASAQFLNHRPFPTYSLENMPDTGFSCKAKILGGYYADSETQCQMFHICVKVAGIGVQDFRFLCPNGTAFDQDHQICAEWEDVDCDESTLYYSSDNFDLYRIGSGFESKAVKYGEDEETFSLQRAETGDIRLNRDHQVQRVNQQREQFLYKKPRTQSNRPESNRPQNNNNNSNNNNNNNNNNNENDRDIFKGSSSSNFFNNRNNGKETDEDYDDNVNVNQNQDDVQKKKIVRKQQRRPVQNEEQYRDNEQNRRPQPQQQQRKPAEEEQYKEQSRRPQQRRPVQSNEQFRSNQENRRPVQNNEQYNQQDRKEQSQDNEDQTSRPVRPTGFVNNFAGSSYNPTTSRPVSTTINDNQYTAAVNNHRQRNGGQRQRNNGERQYNNADNFRQTSSSSSYTVSTPAPFKQTQQYNTPKRPSTQNNYNNNNDDGQYRPTTQAPSKETENYPSNFPKQTAFTTTSQKITQKQPVPTPAPIGTTQFSNQYEVTKIKQNKQTENYSTQAPTARNTQYNNQFSTQYDIPKSKPVNKQSGTSYPTQAPVSRNTQYNNQYSSTQYDVPRTKPVNKQTEANYPTQAPVNRNTQINNQYNTQYDVQKTKATTQAPAIRNTQYNNNNNNNNNNQQFTKTQYNTNSDVSKTNPSKQSDYPTTPYKKTENYPTNTQFNKKSTPAGTKQTENYPSTIRPEIRPKSTQQGQYITRTDNFPSTFAPRTNSAYSQISQQTTQYKSQQSPQQQASSTPRSTPFTQYTPTVPKISPTTPVPRSNRFDETQYDDGSYNSKYDNDRSDEFLKTAHSQNIASSRNELAKTSKAAQQASTQKPQYESPRPFSVSPNTPKAATDYSKATQRPLENKKVQNTNNNNNSKTKKVKDASYDYAYYDTNVGSEPEYDIDTEIKKSTAKN